MKKTNFLGFIALIALIFGVSFTSCKSTEPDPNAGKIDPGTIAKDSLVAYFPFDADGIDKVASLTPTKSPGVTFVKGQRGNCLQGADNAYLLYSLTGSKIGIMTDGFTVSTWIKEPKVYGDPVPMIFQIGKSTDHFWGNLTWMNERAGDATTGAAIDSVYYKFCFQAGAVDNTQWMADNFWKKFLANQWQYVTLTYTSSTSTFSVYINGILYTERSKIGLKGPNGNPAGALTFSNPDYLTIGAWLTKVVDVPAATDAWMGWFKGNLDELRIYNHGLSATRVKNLYDAEITQLN
jgi:predicted Rdx family selenoprotein